MNPPRTEILYDFIEAIRRQSTKLDNRGPVVVHCSAGIGRTGTFIAVENIIENINKYLPIDVFNTVLELRKNRFKMVQTELQYRSIYDTVLYYYLNSILKRNDSNKITEKLERTGSMGEKLENVKMEVF